MAKTEDLGYHHMEGATSMRTRPRGISSILYLSILSVIILAGCSGLTDLLGIENGKDGAAGAAGATGATGAEGPSVYIVTSAGERIYSGGVFSQPPELMPFLKHSQLSTRPGIASPLKVPRL
jgi:hypothetical protein